MLLGGSTFKMPQLSVMSGAVVPRIVPRCLPPSPGRTPQNCSSTWDKCVTRICIVTAANEEATRQTCGSALCAALTDKAQRGRYSSPKFVECDNPRGTECGRHTHDICVHTSDPGGGIHNTPKGLPWKQARVKGGKRIFAEMRLI